MKLFGPFTLFLFLLSSLASAVEIKLTKDWKIWMTAKSCEELKPEIAAITEWRLRLGESAPAQAPCDCAKKKCQVDITEILPKFAKKVTGIFPENEGPNCSNTALLANGILPHMRESSAQELTFWLESPLCVQREKTGQLRAGDLLTIRSNFGKKEEHAFIFISPNLSFSKKSNSSDDAYSLLPTEEVLKQYPPSKGCESFKAGADCKTRVDAFDCQTLAQYLELKPKLGGSDKFVAQVERQEKRLETGLFTSEDDFYAPIIKALAPISKAITVRLAEVAPADLNETDVLILHGLRHRIQSMKEQKEKFGSGK